MELVIANCRALADLASQIESFHNDPSMKDDCEKMLTAAHQLARRIEMTLDAYEI